MRFSSETINSFVKIATATAFCSGVWGKDQGIIIGVVADDIATATTIRAVLEESDAKEKNEEKEYMFGFLKSGLDSSDSRDAIDGKKIRGMKFKNQFNDMHGHKDEEEDANFNEEEGYDKDDKKMIDTGVLLDDPSHTHSQHHRDLAVDPSPACSVQCPTTVFINGTIYNGPTFQELVYNCYYEPLRPTNCPVTIKDYKLNCWDVSTVTNMRGAMFNRDRTDSNGLDVVGPLECWNVGQVTDMSRMFYSSNVNRNIETWDVSSVTDMSSMFNTANKFNQPLNEWNVSAVDTMAEMFESCLFNQPINEWDVGNVRDMEYMFKRNKVFDQPLGLWDTSNVLYMNSMFAYAYKFNQPIDTWDVSNVDSMDIMFLESRSFNQCLGTWADKTSPNVGTDFMLESTGCSSLVSCTPNPEVGPWCQTAMDGCYAVVSPTASPTNFLTITPTASPTDPPTASPTRLPTISPTAPPTVSPTASPTTPQPSSSPTKDITGFHSVVAGGSNNTALADFCTVSGGEYNSADVGKFATVGGGNKNDSTGPGSTVSGGEDNKAKAESSTVSGGLKNIAKGKFSLVSGGNSNTASGLASVVIGGSNNQANGANSIAMGKNANAKKDRSLVINLGTKKVSSTNDGELLVSSDSFTLRIDNEEATIDKKNIKNFKDLLENLESCDDKDNIVNVKNNGGKFKKITCAAIKEKGFCNNKVKKQKGTTAADFCCSCEADRRLEQINKQQAINEELHKLVNAQQKQIGILEGKTSTIDSDNIETFNNILNSGRRILSNDNEELELLREKVLKQDQEDLEQRILIEHLQEETDMMKNTFENLQDESRVQQEEIEKMQEMLDELLHSRPVRGDETLSESE